MDPIRTYRYGCARSLTGAWAMKRRDFVVGVVLASCGSSSFAQPAQNMPQGPVVGSLAPTSLLPAQSSQSPDLVKRIAAAVGAGDINEIMRLGGTPHDILAAEKV